MKKSIAGFAVILIMNSLITSFMINSQDISLPSPSRKGGMPLMEALDAMASVRLFSEKDLSLQQLSDLLWAAWGDQPRGRRQADCTLLAQQVGDGCLCDS